MKRERGKIEARAKDANWSASDAALHFNEAVRHHQAGRLREAEHHYRLALSADSKHADSLHLLGVLAHQIGNHQAAVDLIGQALAVTDAVPEFHYNIGLAYAALRRFDASATHNARAIALRPNYAEAHLNLGNALLASGKAREAVASYRTLLAFRGDLPIVFYNLANALAEAGQSDEAEAQYRRAIALQPDYAEAYANLGSLLMDRGAAEEAAALQRRALELRPDLVKARINLAGALRAQGRLEDAIAAYREALAQDPRQAEAHLSLGVCLMTRDDLHEAAACFRRALALKPDFTFAAVNYARVLLDLGDARGALAEAKRVHEAFDTAETRTLLFDCLRDSRARVFALQYRDELVRALTESWGEARELVPVATSLINADLAVARPPIGSADAAMRRDTLLIALMQSAPVADLHIERMLTAARSAELTAALASSSHHESLDFVCALARQCFLNDYVFACPEDEARNAEALRESIDDAMAAGAAVAPHAIAVLASYMPLTKLAAAEALALREWPVLLAPIITQQIVEPRMEADTRAAIPSLTRIDDTISQAVRAQYEENPYPRWTQVAGLFTRRPIDAFMRERFPLSPYRPLGRRTLDYLLAGCGTGRQVAAVMQSYAEIEVTAVDLSLASLAYAKRKTDALGFKVAYGQADILQLPSLGRSFDVVDSAGVLHHMGDPAAGWRTLISLLRPDGLMRVGLYSTIARRDVAAARKFLAERGHPPTPDGVRRGRAALFAMPEGSPERHTTRSRDFATLSECRDLLFHVQEHTFTLPEIGAFLAESGLDFIGFDARREVLRQYSERFREDPARTDLANWHALEQDSPALFAGMYQFWVQKRRT